MVKFFGQLGVVDRVRKLWKQLTPPVDCRPGPLAFSCMTVTLHTGEALVLIHSHGELGEGQGLHQHCDLQHRSLRSTCLTHAPSQPMVQH